MARPQKQTVDYFPHYANASEGKTIFILDNRFGNNGFAFWFRLLELLCNTPGQTYDYNKPESWQFLIAKMRVNEGEANEILKILADLNAIDPKLHAHKIIWSQNLIDNLTDVYKRRKCNIPQRPESVFVIKGKDSVNNNTISVNNNGVSRHKVNKSKVNKSIYIPYTEFSNVNKMTKEEHQKLIDQFGEVGTRDRIENLSLYISSKGDKYKNHYATILAWEKRDQKGGQSGAHRQNPRQLRPRGSYTDPDKS